MALALSVGAVLWFDLRLLGWTMRDDRVSEVFRAGAAVDVRRLRR